MGLLHVKLRNAKRDPLDDETEVQVLALRTNRLVASKRLPKGSSRVTFDVGAGQPYSVRAFPSRHRPVGHIVLMPFDGPATAELFCPINPERVSDVVFPDYERLPPELAKVLDSSSLEGWAAEIQGGALYTGLTAVQRAGLLNLFSKMHNFGFDQGHTVWSAVTRLYRVLPDRIFVDVEAALRDRVQKELRTERFREVSGKLHTPPPGFDVAGSFKTDERHGNLQLSFFVSQTNPVTFKVDADIDDVAGVGHVFQVLRNFVTAGATHPYDIHQILTFRQEVPPLYDLA